MDTAVFEQQLQALLDEFKGFQSRSKYDDLSDLPSTDRQALVSGAIAAIHRISGQESTYSKEVERILKLHKYIHDHTSPIMGVVKALLNDLKAGFIRTLIEIVHSDIFGDFLEKAQHLCDSGYKDAAAVIVGSTLESHIRELCIKTGIPIEVAKPNGDVVSKKTDQMNSELAAAGTYSKLDQKSVTAWLDLRNKAAHGRYGEYMQEQVSIMVAGVRDFITRNVA